jgi:hypothetical protein
LNSDATPCVDALTIFDLRFCIVATSNASEPTEMPCVANSLCAR